MMQMAKKPKKKAVHVKAKKKESIARAVAKPGEGKIKINKRSLSIITPAYVRRMIQEPLDVVGDTARNIDIAITVSGGGFMGQAVASRSAVAKAIVAFTKDEKIRKDMLAYDRLLLVDDPRRVEPKKPLGTKARKKKQSSKR